MGQQKHTKILDKPMPKVKDQGDESKLNGTRNETLEEKLLRRAEIDRQADKLRKDGADQGKAVENVRTMLRQQAQQSVSPARKQAIGKTAPTKVTNKAAPQVAENPGTDESAAAKNPMSWWQRNAPTSWYGYAAVGIPVTCILGWIYWSFGLSPATEVHSEHNLDSIHEDKVEKDNSLQDYLPEVSGQNLAIGATIGTVGCLCAYAGCASCESEEEPKFRGILRLKHGSFNWMCLIVILLVLVVVLSVLYVYSGETDPQINQHAWDEMRLP